MPEIENTCISTWNELCFADVSKHITLEEFWNGINVWIQRPHILNRKLTAVEVIDTCYISFNSVNYDRETIKKQIIDYLCCVSHVTTNNVSVYLQSNLNIDLDRGVKEKRLNWESFNKYDLILQFRNLLPKNLSKFKNVFEMLIIDKLESSLTFCASRSDVEQSAISPLFPYKIKKQNKGLSLEIYTDKKGCDAVEDTSKEWLKTIVLPKISRWCQNPPSHTIVSSLSLVCPKLYNENYNYLKNKYGKKLVKMWPETTDPLKFVYEDISIAAYLLTLWKKEKEVLQLEHNQSFVDLGCGNGLLVHILSSEGHKGVGIDLRKRNIWEMYGVGTVLIESTATPSDKLLFPEYDWIIGNHSDELTPWIPVIAARSSYNMRAFLLPCCCFTFNGKYERIHSDCTKYQSYLLFIRELCSVMGFEVQQDKLRIPSTKRVCFICSSRNYTKEEETKIELQRKEFIKLHSKKNETMVIACTKELFCTSQFSASEQASENGDSNTSKIFSKEDTDNTCWVENFKPREKLEVIRNCTGLDELFLKETLAKIINILLETDNYVELQTTSGSLNWNAGGKLSILELVKKTDRNTLQCLKNQCGGMQTLLRNYKSVFQTENGLVSLRIPNVDTHSSLSPCRKRARKNYKQQRSNKRISLEGKICYFFFHHPQGCPLSSEVCSYSHSKNCI